MNINSDLIAYFKSIDPSKRLLSEINSKHEVSDLIVYLLKARIGNNNFLETDRDGILLLYKRLSLLYHIPFPVYLLEILKQNEENKLYPTYYRDHLLHSFYVFCLGCYIFDNSQIFIRIPVLDTETFLLIG